MFFTDERHQFFKPLTGKYREQIVECLRLLHEKLYSSRADYGESLRREQILDLFSEALERAPLLEGDEEGRFNSNREQASWILNALVEHGWLKRDKDEASFQSTYPFSRSGRLFTQTLAEMGGRSVRTRHRNTRNTLNALSAFLERGEAYDLLDAYDLIAEARLEHQARQIKAGSAPDNFLSPAALSDFDRSHLRDAFVVVKSLQSALGHGTGPLG